MTRGARGSASTLVVVFVAVLLLVGAACGVVAAMIHGHRTAQAAADLAAIAGAGARADGRDPCATAREIAAANGGSLSECRVEGEDVWVEVTVTGPRWLGQESDLVGQARAGPV